MMRSKKWKRSNLFADNFLPDRTVLSGIFMT